MEKDTLNGDVFYCESDPMNPLCIVWTFKGADRWYWTRDEAERAYKKQTIITHGTTD
jgi:hypothetical protein